MLAAVHLCTAYQTPLTSSRSAVSARRAAAPVAAIDLVHLDTIFSTYDLLAKADFPPIDTAAFTKSVTDAYATASPIVQKSIEAAVPEIERNFELAKPVLEQTAKDLAPVVAQGATVVGPVVVQGLTTAGSALIEGGSVLAKQAGDTLLPQALDALSKGGASLGGELNAALAANVDPSQKAQIDGTLKVVGDGASAAVTSVAPVVEAGIKAATPYVQEAGAAAGKAVGAFAKDELRSVLSWLEDVVN